MQKRTIYIIILFLAVSLIFAGFYLYKRYFYQSRQGQETKQEKKDLELTKEEILKSLTAPEEKKEFTSEDKKIMEDLSAPEKTKIPSLSDEETKKILESLSAPVKQ